MSGKNQLSNPTKLSALGDFCRSRISAGFG